jgi:hypothetical protein
LYTHKFLLLFGFLFLDVELFIQFVHQVYVDENDDDKDVDRALLGKPEPEFEASDLYFVQYVDENDAAAVGNDEPDPEKNR